MVLGHPHTVLGPAAFGRRPDEPFPSGVRVELDRRVRRPTPTVLFGGTPPRLLRLTPRAAELLAALEIGLVASPASARLARRLVDAGMATPRPGPTATPVDVTVVVPVRDRPVELAECLGALGDRYRVVVVDDGSVDRERVAAACRSHGAELVRREAPGGPAAARNAGLRLATTDLVAFVDSDCLPGAGWIEALAGHLVDPLVVGVAPRIVAVPPGRAPSLLDLGTRPARVHPESRVSHVPAAAVLFRRPPLGDGFDEALRYGEDVDLVWRLAEAGWRVRYAPEVEVGHRDPVATGPRLRRRYRYGTSVGPLERRHPGAITHLTVGVGPACAVGGLLLGRSEVAALAGAVTAVQLHRRLRPLAVGAPFALRLTPAQVFHAWVGLGRWCSTFGLPLVAGAFVGRRTAIGRRALRRLALLVGSALVADAVGRTGRVGRDGRLGGMGRAWLGEVAYGTGVAVGCARAGVLGPVVPRIRARPGAAVSGAARAGVRR